MGTPNVLIVEDNAELGSILAEVLTLEGFETETASDGQKALDMLAARRPDVLILDMHLPKVSGVDVLRHVRSSLRLSGLAVIVMTADERLSRDLGKLADGVLVKPASIVQLVQMCKEFVRA